jgi:hypothetical protein
MPNLMSMQVQMDTQICIHGDASKCNLRLRMYQTQLRVSVHNSELEGYRKPNPYRLKQNIG